MERTADTWIARPEALARLGVKTQTLYAYVSRGRIAARPDPRDPRRSLYAAADVARLRDGTIETPTARPSLGAVGRGEAAIDSAVSLIAGGRLFYRGRDAVQLAEAATLEETARVLWDVRGFNPFAELKPRVDVAFAGLPKARILSFLARRAFEDASSRDRSGDDLAVEAAAILAEMIDAVAGAGPRLHLHQRLTRAWKMSEADGQLLRRALVLCADQGMDAAVLATRAVVQAGGSLASGVMAGTGALCAPDVIGDLYAVVGFVGQARGRPTAEIAARGELGVGIPGFGGSGLGDPDPRASALIAAAALGPDLTAVLEAGRQAAGRPPTFALALALAARRMELPREAACDIWMIGRTCGLLAHALDQAENGSPIRARLRYVGVEPGAN